MRNFTTDSPFLNEKENRKTTNLKIHYWIMVLCLFLLGNFNTNAQTPEADTPCEAANRWEGGSTWLNNGTINDAPNAGAPNGIIRCGSSAETQSNISPFNNAIYNSGEFLIDVETDGGCVDPSTGLTSNPTNPAEGKPIIWLNFDVRPYSGSFEIQINDNDAADNIAWALFVSDTHTTGTTFNPDAGDELSGDCANLNMQLVSCGVESSNTWNTIPIKNVDFLEPTNFYIAIWDQKGDNSVDVNNFKARYGCGDGDTPVCNLVVQDETVECVDADTYQVVVPIIGANAQFTATDPNALTISDDVCLNNLGDGGPIEGSFTLTYNIGTDYNISISALDNPIISGCADPFNPTQCTGGVSGSSPVPPVADELQDVTRCDSYTLPTLSIGNQYFTGSDATGTELFAGASITISQTIYIYAAATEFCSADESEFDITIHDTPVADDPADVTRCDSYILPALSAGNAYWTGQNGTGTEVAAGTAITTTTTLYIYAAATAPCEADENDLVITIHDTPVADDPADVTRCDSYTLPALSAGNAYWTGQNGTGTEVAAGTAITTTTTLYIYAAATAPCEADENDLVITIHDTPVADDPADVTRCDSYTLPALSAGNAYWTGQNGTGTEVAAGTAITTTTTLYVYAAATAPCEADENDLVITINDTPVADDPADVTRCDSYTLPALSAGNAYWTGQNGTGTEVAAGTAITTTTTLYVYAAATAPCEADENDLVITIHDTPVADDPADVTRCDSYTLPALSAGNAYWTGQNGTGTEVAAGTAITTTTTLYIYAAATAPCEADENDLVITIHDTPVADDPADVTRCDSYTLPALSAGNAYWTAPGGAGGTGTEVAAGTAITTTTTLYIYAAATAPCEADENDLVITINDTPVADDPEDVTRCDSYTLPALSAGNAYWTGQNGTGTEVASGTAITTTTTLYVYAAATAPCEADENDLVITINDTPVADDPADVTRCDSYILPALSAGNAYWTGQNGTGTEVAAGTAITTTTTLYIYAAATAPCEADENDLVITIHDTPVADDPADVTRCDSYTLPALSAGNAYWTGQNGTGTEVAAGTAITTTTTLYIYAAATAPCEADENDLVITIHDTPVADDPADVTRCDSYTLPALSAGNAYWTAPGGAGGTGTEVAAGTAITTTTTLYIYAAATAPCEADENDLVITINDTPVADDPADVTRCDSYTLPALSAGNAYWTGQNGTGTEVAAGTAITTTTTLYVYFAATAPCEADENDLVITINDTPVADDPADVTRCDSYTLPALSAGNAYWTGQNGTGTEVAVGTAITTTTTLYVYAAATAPCEADENDLVITINDTPVADDPADVTRCDSYILPALSAGNAYWTGQNGTGTEVAAGTAITTTTTLYVYAAATAPCEADENDLVITINNTPAIPEIETQLADCIGGDGSFIFLGNPQNLFISFDNGENFELYEGAISLPVGSHDFVIKYGEDGCVSDSGEVEIQQLPATDFPLNPTITQPDCETGLGNVVLRVGANTDIDTGFFTYRISIGETVFYNEKQTTAGFDLPPGNYVIFGISDNGCDSGRTEITLEEPICEVFEGCTLGYWKNHTDRWSCYSTCTLYSDVFGNSTPSELQGKTLLEVLNLGGGGIYNLGRQSVAALLNICNADVNYEISTEAELIAYVQDNFNDAGAAGSHLDELNNAGCTLGGSKATSEPSEGCDESEDTRPGKGKPYKASNLSAGFIASPVPFNDRLTLKYDFEYTSNRVEIQIFDMGGKLLRTYNDKRVSKGDTKDLDIDFALKANQVYIVRMITDREVISKNIISSSRR